MKAVQKELLINNQFGLHGRPATKLAELAKKFEADIRLLNEDESVDCKSILDVMTMACTKGTPVSIMATGIDAQEALDAIAHLIQNKFDEE